VEAFLSQVNRGKEAQREGRRVGAWGWGTYGTNDVNGKIE
jgi:hypothetical protein